MHRVERALKRYHRELFSLPNVVGVGKGYKEVRGKITDTPALIVMVEKKLPEEELRRQDRIPRLLDKAATDVWEVGQIRLLGRTDYQRPAQPGVSIGHYKITAGTFGAVVKDRSTGEPLILSNNHILANISNGRDGRAAIGDPILQPGPYDGGTMDQIIGHLLRFVPLISDYQEPLCSQALYFERLLNNLLHLIKPRYRLFLRKATEAANIVDAAVARPIRPEDINPEILGLGPITGIAEAEIGMAVVKSGRSSGITRASVKVLQASVQVILEEGLKGFFTDQIVTGPLAQPGDSGSLVLDNSGRAVGLLFAGSNQSTVCNRIQNVLDSLNVTF